MTTKRNAHPPQAVAIPGGGVMLFRGPDAAKKAAAYRASSTSAARRRPLARQAAPLAPKAISAPKRSRADVDAIATMLAARTDLPAELRSELRALSVSQVRDVLAAMPTPEEAKRTEARDAQRLRMMQAAGMQVPTVTELRGTTLYFGVKKPTGGDQ